MTTRTKLASLLVLAAALSGCATLARAGVGENPRDRLWSQAYWAFRADSFAVATSRYERLASEHADTREGREARFYLGALFLDPRNPAFDSRRAAMNLETYTRQDTVRGVTLYNLPEAATLLSLARQVEMRCEERVPALRCETQVVERRVPVPGEPPPARNGASAAEVDRLRAELAERDAQVRRLREELERIRNTLAPRRP